MYHWSTVFELKAKNIYFDVKKYFKFFNAVIIYHLCFVVDRDYWYEEARLALKKRLAGYEGKTGRAKNVVFLVGDGMGASTLTASRIFKGQRRGNQGEEEQLLWDAFPAVAMAKVGNYIPRYNI